MGLNGLGFALISARQSEALRICVIVEYQSTLCVVCCLSVSDLQCCCLHRLPERFLSENFGNAGHRWTTVIHLENSIWHYFDRRIYADL